MTETLLAFDFGAARIGVAVGNTLLKEASPLGIVRNPSAEQSFADIAMLIEHWQPQRLVVGVPRSPSGTASPMSARCEKFARQLEGRFALPVHRVDETYSSIDAQSQHRAARSAGHARARRATDDLAAAVILQRYFDERDASVA